MLNNFRWRDAEADATAALKLAPDDLKALFRRGLARTELREWSLARQGKERPNFSWTELIYLIDIQAYLDGGGCLAEGNAVLDAIANFEIAAMPNQISDKSDDSNEIFDIFPFDDSRESLFVIQKSAGKACSLLVNSKRVTRSSVKGR